MTNRTTLPGDFIDGMRHAADEDDAAGHSLQAAYMRKAADEIERLLAAIGSVQRSAFDAGYDAHRNGHERVAEYRRWSNT